MENELLEADGSCKRRVSSAGRGCAGVRCLAQDLGMLERSSRTTAAAPPMRPGGDPAVARRPEHVPRPRASASLC
jgi:hypothetical protein